MARKFYTCIIVPDASQQLHKLRVPIQALYVCAGIGLLSFFVAVGLGFHYLGMASRMETLQSLEAENAKLKVDTRQLRLATTQLSRQVAALESEAEIITKAIQEDPLLRRLGGTREIEVDVRLITATNHDLEKQVKEGTFREDLYYRLSVLPLRLPPLCGRHGNARVISRLSSGVCR